MNAVRLTVRGLLLAACFCLEAVYLLSFESSRFGLANYFFWVLTFAMSHLCLWCAAAKCLRR